MPVIVGLTCSLDDKEARIRETYLRAVALAGGVPILLPPPGARATDSLKESVSSPDSMNAEPLHAIARAHLDLCHAIVFTGGPDPRTERYGEPTHPAAEPLHPDRQRYEEALLTALDERRAIPVLGVCLGMQLMALHAGGSLNQHLPDDTPTHADHMNDRLHAIVPIAGAPIPSVGGAITSHHHQAVRNPGRLRIIARAPDGVIEAIDDPARHFYLGVQWHPERTTDPALGARLFERLIRSASPHEPRPSGRGRRG
jgi:putative glutamine amidotransferase